MILHCDDLALNAPIAADVDGDYCSRHARADINHTDLKRVEMPRDPQCELRGKDSTDGSMSVITAGAKGETHASHHVTHGNFDRVRTKARLDTPQNGALSFSATYFHGEIDGLAPWGKQVLVTSPKSIGTNCTSKKYFGDDQTSDSLALFASPSAKDFWRSSPGLHLGRSRLARSARNSRCGATICSTRKKYSIPMISGWRSPPVLVATVPRDLISVWNSNRAATSWGNAFSARHADTIATSVREGRGVGIRPIGGHRGLSAAPDAGICTPFAVFDRRRDAVRPRHLESLKT